MRSSNRNIICVTGLWRRIHRWPMNSPHQGPVTQNFDVSYDLRLNKRLCKQSKRQWFDTPSHSLWRHCKCNFCVLIHDRCLRMYLYISMLFCQTLKHRHAVNICAQTASHSYFCLHRTNCATSFGQKSKFAWRSLWDADDLSTSDLREGRDENRCMFVVVLWGIMYYTPSWQIIKSRYCFPLVYKIAHISSYIYMDSKLVTSLIPKYVFHDCWHISKIFSKKYARILCNYIFVRSLSSARHLCCTAVHGQTNTTWYRSTQAISLFQLLELSRWHVLWSDYITVV